MTRRHCRNRSPKRTRFGVAALWRRCANSRTLPEEPTHAMPQGSRRRSRLWCALGAHAAKRYGMVHAGSAGPSCPSIPAASDAGTELPHAFARPNLDRLVPPASPPEWPRARQGREQSALQTTAKVYF